MSTDDEYKIEEEKKYTGPSMLGKIMFDLSEMMKKRREADYEPSSECKDICTIVMASMDMEDTLKKLGELANYNIKVSETLGPEKDAKYKMALSSARLHLCEAAEIIQELTPQRLKARDVWKKDDENKESDEDE